jgi:hypothetical protein
MIKRTTTLILATAALAPVALAQSVEQSRARAYDALIPTTGAEALDVNAANKRLAALQKLFPNVDESELMPAFNTIRSAVQSGQAPASTQTPDEQFGDWVRLTSAPIYVVGTGFKTTLVALIAPFHSVLEVPEVTATKRIARKLLDDFDTDKDALNLSAYKAVLGKAAVSVHDANAALDVVRAFADQSTGKLSTLRTAQEDPEVKLTAKSRLSFAASVPTEKEGLYYFGLSYAINKYVHATAGFSFLAADDKRGKLAYGLSFDLSVFQAMLGGGKKDKPKEDQKPKS